MSSVAVFGGTTEGRELCELSAKYSVPATYCVATPDGARAAEHLRGVNVHIGRMDAAEMAALLGQIKPALVIDATHPYAREAHSNIAAACAQIGILPVRIRRECALERGDIYFSSMDELIVWLEGEQGNIFAATGSSSARALCALTDYKNRVWLRILPGMENTCLSLGYRAERLTCMQGPFTERQNREIFEAANARILITKDSGVAGGFSEKLRAARSLNIVTAVLTRPGESGGVTMEAAGKMLMELAL